MNKVKDYRLLYQQNEIKLPALTKNFTDGPPGHFAIHKYRSLCFLHCEIPRKIKH